MTGRIPDSLRTYIEAQILPRYDGFDAAHRRDHAETVIRQSFALAATCVRRMTLQRSPATSAKVLIPAKFLFFK